MTYAELMGKLKKGEALTAEEVTELEKLSRPAERFNEVVTKAQKLESDLKTKEKEVEGLIAQNLTEAQKLQDEVQRQLAELGGKVETLSTENVKLSGERDGMVKSLKVRELAMNNPTGAMFGDPEYLGFIFSRDKVDLNDSEQVKTALLALKDKMPEQFKVSAKGGSGAGLGNTSGGKQVGGAPAKDWTFAQKADYLKNGGSVDEYMKMVNTEG